MSPWTKSDGHTFPVIPRPGSCRKNQKNATGFLEVSPTTTNHYRLDDVEDRGSGLRLEEATAMPRLHCAVGTW